MAFNGPPPTAMQEPRGKVVPVSYTADYYFWKKTGA